MVTYVNDNFQLIPHPKPFSIVVFHRVGCWVDAATCINSPCRKLDQEKLQPKLASREIFYLLKGDEYRLGTSEVKLDLLQSRTMKGQNEVLHFFFLF